MEVDHGLIIVDILHERFGPQVLDMSRPEPERRPDGRPRLRVITSLPEPGETPAPPSPGPA
jgi:hypothetical protein